MSLIEYIRKEPQLLESSEIIFFGGSFNPWHMGHTSCLELAPNDKPLVVIPDHNPHKQLTISSDKQVDLEGIKKHISIRAKNTYIFELFYLQNKKNPTQQWINELKKTFPQKSFSLLIGFDSFININTWTKANELLNDLDSLYVVSRLDKEELKNKQIASIQKISKKLKIYFLGNHPFENLSSTNLRKAKN